MSGSIKVKVDDNATDAVVFKGALPSSSLEKLQTRVVDVGVDTLSAAIGGALGNIFTVVESLPRSPNGSRVSAINFSLAIDANGEVSLLSIAKGGVTARSALQFTISFDE